MKSLCYDIACSPFRLQEERDRGDRWSLSPSLIHLPPPPLVGEYPKSRFDRPPSLITQGEESSILCFLSVVFFLYTQNAVRFIYLPNYFDIPNYFNSLKCPFAHFKPKLNCGNIFFFT